MLIFMDEEKQNFSDESQNIYLSNWQETFLKFNKETTIFDTSLIYALESSGFIQPGPLASSEFFTTYVTRATIVGIHYDYKKVHKECGCCLLRGKCPLCSGMDIPFQFYEETLVLTLSIDDGSCPHVQVIGLQSNFPNWGISTEGFKSASKEDQDLYLQRLFGKEFVFVISKGSSKEFGELQDSSIWRIDQCLMPDQFSILVGDTERTVKRLIDFHKTLDNDE